MCGAEPATSCSFPWLAILIVALLIGAAGYQLLSAKPGDGQVFRGSIKELEVELHPGDLEEPPGPPAPDEPTTGPLTDRS